MGKYLFDIRGDRGIHPMLRLRALSCPLGETPVCRQAGLIPFHQPKQKQALSLFWF